ncbi:MAG: thioredoxin domain-containing protein [Bdellovibrio sp.]|nr:thioredoxin domain-containing protein [Bdellovibrio sp.]
MTKKQNLLIISLLVTTGLFIYLTVHHYAIKLGLGGDSFCSVSATMNCDAAALSSYAELFNIPVSILGGVFTLFLLGFVANAGLGWIQNSVYLKNSVRAMLVFAALVSFVMGFISLVYVKVICPVCVATYVFSIINLALGWNAFNTDSREKFDIFNYFTTYRSHLIAFILIPVFSWVAAGMIQENYGLNELKKMVPEKVAQWRGGFEHQLDYSLGISNKGTSTKVVIVEYADFKCPHCRDASKTFQTFLKANPDVHVIMKPYPLDGICNFEEKMPKGDGSRCILAGYAMCAEKLSQKGWEVQEWLFSKQDEFIAATDLKPFLSDFSKQFGLDAVAIGACAESSETYDLLKKITAEGSKAQVSGTPTVYLNRKKLPYGNILEVLKTAVNEVK